MTAAIAEAYGFDPLVVLEWPARKRLFYANILSAHPDRRAAANGHADAQAHAQAQAQAQAQQFGGANAGAGAQPAQSHPNLPDGLDPADIPTPQGVENPYASPDPNGAGTGAGVGASPSVGPAGGGRSLSSATQHPKVARHGTVVDVGGAPDPADHPDIPTDDDGNLIPQDDADDADGAADSPASYDA